MSDTLETSTPNSAAEAVALPNVLKKSDINAEGGLAKTHFLNNNAQRINKSLGDLTGLTGIGVHLIEVEPGKESTEYHKHYHEDECTYVLSGSGTVIIGDQKHLINAGDFIAYPKGGDAHTMLNTGSETLRCLVIGERLPFDIADYPKLAKRIYREADKPWNLVDHKNIVEPVAGAKTKG